MNWTSRRVIAAVDLNARAEEVICLGADIARRESSSLLVVHVVEHHTGFEADHAPFLTPSRLRAGLARDARAWLRGLVHQMGMGDTEILVASGETHSMLVQVATEWRAQCVVTGRLKWGAISKLAGLAGDDRLAAISCDVLHAVDDKASFFRRAVQWAGQWFAADEGSAR